MTPRGNWTVNVGFRYDLQGGTNEPGSTGVSVTPEIFPEITLDEPLDAGFDWESITPRIGATYALGEDRDTLLRASFSQFPQSLTTAMVSFLNPMLPTFFGSYAYFSFFDDDGDNQFRGNESYSFLFGSGYDDENPTTTWNTVDPGFDPEITSEAVLAVEHSLLPEFVVALSYTWRKVDDVAENRPYVRPEWSSGRGFTATADDYVLDRLTSATLPDGTESSQPVYRLDSSLELSGGFSHLQNGSRSREYDGVTLTANKRLANRWSMRGFLTWGETEWRVPADYVDNHDPTDGTDTDDNDGGLFMVDGGGRLDVYLQSTWQWNLTGIYQVAPDRPWGFDLAANLYGREGYVLPYNDSLTAGGIAKSVSHVGGDVDRFRNDDITTVDLRAEKTFGINSDVNLTFGVDLFNALNEAPVLARTTTLNRQTADWVQDVLSPRIWRLGVRLSWK